jgi:hypothetical protein
LEKPAHGGFLSLEAEMTARQLKELLASAGLSLLATPKREQQNGRTGKRQHDAPPPERPVAVQQDSSSR